MAHWICICTFLVMYIVFFIIYLLNDSFISHYIPLVLLPYWVKSNPMVSCRKQLVSNPGLCCSAAVDMRCGWISFSVSVWMWFREIRPPLTLSGEVQWLSLSGLFCESPSAELSPGDPACAASLTHISIQPQRRAHTRLRPQFHSSPQWHVSSPAHIHTHPLSPCKSLCLACHAENNMNWNMLLELICSRECCVRVLFVGFCRSGGDFEWSPADWALKTWAY